MISGILWDNDGVLVDTERVFYEVNREFLRLHQIELSEGDFFEWFLCENRGAWHLLIDQGSTSQQIDNYRRQRNAFYTERLRSETGLAIPGVENVLAKLGKRVEMGIVTSANRVHFDAIHSKLDLIRHFKFALTEEDYTNSKPSPEPYLLGLKHLEVKPQHCLAVEDSPRGLQAALAAGIKCIVLRNRLSRHHTFVGAHRVVDSMPELLAEIEALL